MKLLSLRNQFVAALTLALVMLFGCSSTEEAPPSDSSDSSGGGVDCSTYPTETMQQECELAKEMID